MAERAAWNGGVIIEAPMSNRSGTGNGGQGHQRHGEHIADVG